MNFFSYPIVWLPSLLAAIGVGLLAHTGVDALHELFQRGLRRRLTLAVRLATRSAQTESRLLSEAELYGLPHNLAPVAIGAVPSSGPNARPIGAAAHGPVAPRGRRGVSQRTMCSGHPSQRRLRRDQ